VLLGCKALATGIWVAALRLSMTACTRASVPPRPTCWPGCVRSAGRPFRRVRHGAAAFAPPQVRV
jgi:hypothetical protein